MLRARFPLVAATFGLFLSPLAQAQLELPMEERLQMLLNIMTLEEKVGQLSQASYAGSPAHQAQVLQWASEGKLGSVLNCIGAEEFNKLQQAALTRTRLKIPLLNGADVIHGYRTQFPIPLAQSCSWNPSLVEQAARVAAVEARAGGVNWTFAPMIDIARDPRWGRIAEGAGEDPYLGSVMAAAQVRGYQTADPAHPTALAATAKHFAGYGAAEAGRDYNTTLIPETELRNVYFPPFKAAVDAGVLTFMAAFNDLNGTPASANPFLMRTVLRQEWGFSGMVVSDWDSVKELTLHGVAGTPAEAAALSLKAGVDMEMVSRFYADNAVNLVRSGKVPLRVIDEAVRAILVTKFRLGLLDQPYAATDQTATWLAPEHLALARQLAVESMVLLKNDGNRLPLPADFKKIAVIGPLAENRAALLGSWTSEGKPEDTVTIVEGLRAALGSTAEITYVSGLAHATDLERTGFAAALEAARAADLVIYCVGETEQMSGEARSRAFLGLPGAQSDLIQEVARSGKPSIALVFAGRPLVMDAFIDRVDALLYAWQPGTQAGHAVADLLTGQKTPSGKLTTTFPRAVGQIPLYYNHRHTGRPPANEDLNAPLGTPQDPRGYTSKHLDVHSTPAFPFGYGLSYTTFAYAGIEVSMPDEKGDRVVRATVTNTGPKAGLEIAQLYVRDPVASLSRPVRELKGFSRVELAPGESKSVEFALPKSALGFYGADGKFVVEPGRFQVWVGGDSTAALSAEFELK